jgi:hypothetical protein
MTIIRTTLLGTAGKGTIILAGNKERIGVRTMITEEGIITNEVAVTAEITADEEIAVEAAEEVTTTTIVSIIMMIIALFMAGTNGASAF